MPTAKARTPDQGYQIVKNFRQSGCSMDKRSIAAIEWAEEKAGFKFLFAQGSYNSDVQASAGTHDGGGVIDFKTRHLTKAQRRKMIVWLKRAGFCIWFRPDNWDGKGGGQHAHGVLRGHRNLAYGAEQQVLAFDARRDGLKSNRVDLTYRPNPKVRFNYVRNEPLAA